MSTRAFRWNKPRSLKSLTVWLKQPQRPEMRDPFNLSKPPASNPEPIWIKQPLSYKMRDPFSLSKSRSLKSFPTPSPSLPEASSLLRNENI